MHLGGADPRMKPMTAFKAPGWSLRAAVDRVRALFERAGESAESDVEHRAHQRAARAAFDLVVDEETDARTLALDLVLERPDVFEMAERPVDIFDPDLEAGLVERDAARESLANELVADGHAGDQRFPAPVVHLSAAHP